MSSETKAQIATNLARTVQAYSAEFRRAENLAEKLASARQDIAILEDRNWRMGMHIDDADRNARRWMWLSVMLFAALTVATIMLSI